MIQQNITAAYTASGPDKANIITIQKNFENLFAKAKELEEKVKALETRASELETRASVLETKVTTLEATSAILETKVAALETKASVLETKVAALETKVSSASKTLGTAASVASGGTVYVAGSEADPFVAGPFVTGPSIGPGKVLITDPDGTVREAVDGRDFYWDRDAQPVFFKDLEVVSVTRVSGNADFNYPDGLPPNRPGYISTNYNNGFSTLEQIPLAEWNPPLAAVSELPKDQARELLNEYMDSRGLTFMTNGGTDELGSWLSDDYRFFLESKGITGPST